MAIRKQLHDVLALTAELTHNNTNGDVRHTLVIDRMGLPEHETHRYIHELESLGMVKIQPQMNQNTDEKGREFRQIKACRNYHLTKLRANLWLIRLTAHLSGTLVTGFFKQYVCSIIIFSNLYKADFSKLMRKALMETYTVNSNTDK